MKFHTRITTTKKSTLLPESILFKSTGVTWIETTGTSSDQIWRMWFMIFSIEWNCYGSCFIFFVFLFLLRKISSFPFICFNVLQAQFDFTYSIDRIGTVFACIFLQIQDWMKFFLFHFLLAIGGYIQHMNSFEHNNISFSWSECDKRI